MSSDQPIAVVVLGELSRSPRMRNHARSLAAAGYDTILIGYRDTPFEPPAGVRVRALHPLHRAGESSSGLAFLCISAVRMALLSLDLLGLLLHLRPRLLLVQNPPALPVTAIAWLLSIPLVADWHNYGWTLLGLRLRPDHPLVRLARWSELCAARTATAHFCVSESMRADLESRGISARLLYDRPLNFAPHDCKTPEAFVAVCPAGWTVDEDIDMLLDAIALLPLHAIEFHLTGDGPRRATLEPRIAELRRSGYRIHTGFLPEPEYYALLRRAGIGLSLHRSSSGVDLAMKVVDLFAAGVPVCALDYGGALPEQVIHGRNGFLFRTAAELASLLGDRAALQSLRVETGETWNAAWTRVAGPLFAGVSG